MGSAPKGGVRRVSRRVMNLAYFLTRSARRFPHATALVWGERTWTWKELDDRVSALVLVLRQGGIDKGDRVLVHSPNANQMIESMLATFRLGAVWVPTNCRLTAEEVAALGEDAQIRAFICDARFSGHAEAVKRVCPEMALLASIGPASFGHGAIDDMMASCLGVDAGNTVVDHDDPCWFFFTSGTTGRSKAAVLTHGQMGFVVTNHLCDLMPGTNEQDASLVVAPLSHGAGIHLLSQVARAAKTILLESERFDVEEVWRSIERYQVTNLFTVPTILKMMVSHAAVDRYDHRMLRYVVYAGAPMYREDQKQAIRKLGSCLVQYFGLGEVTGNITVLPGCLHHESDDVQKHIGSCGFERTGMQVSIQDEDGLELSLGQEGEICVCGLAVFAGYYNNPEANQKAFRDGWFRTGDVGHMDEQGFLHITGRMSDMYVSGGSNVYPREIEEKILEHPAVSEVAVIGVTHSLWGEVGVCICVLTPNQNLTELELLAWLEPKVARYKLPKKVLFWNELPKSGYGKVPKRLVAQELAHRGELPL